MIAGLKDCAEVLAQKRGIPYTEAESILHDVVDIFVDKILSGGLCIRGIFTIRPKVRKSRTGVIHDKTWSIPDRKVLTISTGKSLEERLNNDN